jgi:hypothetical protein
MTSQEVGVPDEDAPDEDEDEDEEGFANSAPPLKVLSSVSVPADQPSPC